MDIFNGYQCPICYNDGGHYDSCIKKDATCECKKNHWWVTSKFNKVKSKKHTCGILYVETDKSESQMIDNSNK
jgi:hypothetical protein